MQCDTSSTRLDWKLLVLQVALEQNQVKIIWLLCKAATRFQVTVEQNKRFLFEALEAFEAFSNLYIDHI